MRRFLQRFPNLAARNFLHSPTIFRHSNTSPCVVPPLNRVTSRFVFFSSEPNSAHGSKSDEVLSKEELKKRIQSFLDDGDEDALPDLFEAMMNRKLSGKHDESDDEVMDEVRKYPINDAHKVDDSDSDTESDDLRDGDSSDSDVESDDLGDGDSSDSEAESDDLGDADSSDSDAESDDLTDCDSSDSDIDSDGRKDVDLSRLDIKINSLKADHSSYSDSKSD
ncbi:hypothetical protein EUTSA_v10019822mg [Eutrema salsugineum]|uniref:Uncharacterized protein n=1 Tax=Eutrema salsugineum TaxID=72664 RepID=V4JRA7_EUTSA|nr:uncharacterized protein LOC18009029 [Eutrema salsugineum]ESQ27795.1 hypothetical protein EUTSA_v10019822mg [Eutrema salsugineum]